MHVTMKFAGQLPVDAAVSLGPALAEMASTWIAPRSVPLQLDAFPSPRHARVVVLSLDDASGRIADLAESVDTLLSQHGVPAEKRAFRPHVTLARLKRAYDAGRWLRMDPAAFAGGCDLAALTLYRSDVGPNGSVYTALARAALHSDVE
jgi:2'-5' RNA ligase